jgi:predicted nucleic acid-binding protein
VNASDTTLVVLDTNVALDLWLFDLEGLEHLRDMLRLASVSTRFIATAAMRDEMEAVLRHSEAGVGPIAASRLGPGRAQKVLAVWDRHVSLVRTPAAAALPSWPRCRDTSDQKFVDLALGARAAWLLTRDRALLKLARRCRPYGLRIAPPEAWPREPWRSESPE